MRVFLAAPFSQWLDPETRRLDAERRRQLDMLRLSLVEQAFSVFSAHHREEWGAALMPSHICTPLDYEEMARADIVCAIVGAPPSSGVCVELGWASAMGKPVLLIVDPAVVHSPLVDGLGTVTTTMTLRIADPWDESHVDQVVDALESLWAVARRGGRDSRPMLDGIAGA